jgi:hypothetical protein
MGELKTILISVPTSALISWLKGKTDITSGPVCG